jgi:hypothetical protein
MIIKAIVKFYNKDNKVRWSEDKEIEISNSWYTVQNYFDENYRAQLLDDDDDAHMITIKWQDKNYEFKRK